MAAPFLLKSAILQKTELISMLINYYMKGRATRATIPILDDSISCKDSKSIFYKKFNETFKIICASKEKE